MPPSETTRQSPTLCASGPVKIATGHGERFGEIVPAARAASLCVVACSPSSCLGCADREVWA